MGKRRNSLNTNSASDKELASKPVLQHPTKRLNYTFDDLFNSNQFKEFEVLTSDNFWEDSGTQSSDFVLNSDDRRLRFGDAASDPQIDRSNSFHLTGKLESDIQLYDYHDVDKRTILLPHFYRHDYPTCLAAKRLIVAKRSFIEFPEFHDALTSCIVRERVEQARTVILTFIDSRSRQPLAVHEMELFLQTIFTVSLDGHYDDLLFDLGNLCKLLLPDGVPDIVVKKCVDKAASVFTSFPYRAVSVGNFLRLFSHPLARSFYDHLLCGQRIDSFLDYLSAELKKDIEDRLKVTERLLFCYCRLTVTDERSPSSDLLRLIRHLKGRLPVAMVGSIVDIQDVLTKLSCFLIANESKRRIV